MVILSIIEGEYSIGDNIGDETILQEHKEFYLNKSMSLSEINNLFKGFISPHIEKQIYDTVIYYINKYFDRYLLSLANIKKIYLQDLTNFTHSKICFGVSDNGNITGIPLKEQQISHLKVELVNKVLDYYSNIIGLQLDSEKGDIEITIQGKIYYNFEKLVHILKKHTRINIHKIKNHHNYNNDCVILKNKIDELKIQEQEYFKKLDEYKKLMNKKIEYNNKYSVPFNKLIRTTDIMDEFRSYTSLTNDQLDDLLELLQEKIVNRGDVEDYLCCGEYIERTLFPDDENMDRYYGELVKIYLEEYKYFKIVQLRKNIVLSKFILKNPIKKLKPLLNNVIVFSEQLKMDFYMIEIEIPFIKDVDAFVASKKTNKILERSYTENNPHTVS